MTLPSADRRVRTALALTGGEVASRLIAFVATAYLAATLGPEGFGVLGFALAVFAFVSIPLTGGFADVGSRAVARAPEQAAALAASTTLLRLVAAVVGILLVWLLAPSLVDTPTETAVLALTALVLLPLAFDVEWVFKGLERGRRVSGALVLRRLAYAVLVFVLVRGPQHVVRAPLAQLVGEFIGVAWLGGSLLGRGLKKPAFRRAWEVLRESGPLMVTKLFRTSIITLDVVLLGLMVGERATGLYTAPYRLVFFVMAVAGALQVAYLPDAVRDHAQGSKNPAARRHLELSAALGLPIAVGGSMLAGPILQAVFGAEYVEAGGALRVLLGALALLFLFAPAHNVLVARNRLRVEAVSIGAAALLNLVLNILWIPRYGIVGAAWATLLAEAGILAAMAAAVWRPRWSGLLRDVRILAGPAVASGLMALALGSIGAQRSLLLTVPAGAAAYGLALWALGGLPEDVRLALRRARARARPS